MHLEMLKYKSVPQPHIANICIRFQICVSSKSTTYILCDGYRKEMWFKTSGYWDFFNIYSF